LPSDDVISWQNPNIQLVCAEIAVKFNIWDVVSVVLSLIIMSCDEVDSLGLFTVGFKTLQSYIMSVWHQMSVARIQLLRQITLLVTMHSIVPVNLHSSRELNITS